MARKINPLFPKPNQYKSYRRKSLLVLGVVIVFVVLCVALYLFCTRTAESKMHYLKKKNQAASKYSSAKKLLTNFDKLQKNPSLKIQNLTSKYGISATTQELAMQYGVFVAGVNFIEPTKPKSTTAKSGRRRSSREKKSTDVNKDDKTLTVPALLQAASGNVDPSLTVQELTFFIQGDYTKVMQFFAALMRTFPGLFIKTMVLLPANERVVELQLEGVMVINQKRLNLSRVGVIKLSKQASSSRPIRNPFWVPIQFQTSHRKKKIEDSYVSYLAQTLLNESKVGRLLTLTMRRHGYYRAIIGGKEFQVGDTIGQLTVTGITPHYVTLEDDQGVLTLAMSGLNTFKSAVQ